MFRETVTLIKDKRIPKGYTVRLHQIRGYDSPDKWFVLRKHGRIIKQQAGSILRILQIIKNDQKLNQ